MPRGRGVDFQVIGLRKLQAELRAVDAAMPKQLRTTNLTAAEMVVQEARPYVPVLTGALRNSLGARASQRYAEAKAGSAVRVPYAAPVHWGWPARNIAPNPFLYEAAARIRGRVVERYRKDIDKLLRLVR